MASRLKYNLRDKSGFLQIINRMDDSDKDMLLT
jgi:hypothetical protein